jgi:Superinfection immunity protein
MASDICEKKIARMIASKHRQVAGRATQAGSTFTTGHGAQGLSARSTNHAKAATIKVKGEGDMTATQTAIVTVIVVAGYFLPTLIAGFRRHHNASAIGMLNLALGWTLLGWIAALV